MMNGDIAYTGSNLKLNVNGFGIGMGLETT